MIVVALDRSWARFYDSGQPRGRQEDSTGLWKRCGSARGQRPGMWSRTLSHFTHRHLPLSSGQPVCGLNHDRHVCDIAASLSQLGDNKTCVFLLFSSCIYKMCCSGEHRPLQIILYLLFLMLRYCLLFQEVAEMANLIPCFT